MDKFLKTISYLVACTAVFLFLVKIQNGPVDYPKDTGTVSNQNTASIYFLDLNEEGNSTCEANGAVKRVVSDQGNTGRKVAEFLVRGLTKEEVDRGFGSAINPKVSINKFEVIDGTALIDFNTNPNENITEQCGATAVRSQIEKTLKSVPGVNNVVISVGGQTEGVLNP